MIRLALVGYGRWGRNYVKAARDAGNCEVAVVVSRNEVSPETRAQYPSISFTGQSFYLTAIKDCDALVYAGHPGLAAHVCCEVIERGKPVVAEKPAGLSLADAERLQAAEAKAGVPVLVNHQHLFAVGYERLRSIVGNGARHVDAMWHGPGPRRDYSALWDYGPHAVAGLLGLVGHATVTNALTLGSKRRFDMELQHANGTARLFISSLSTDKGAHITASVGDGFSAGYDAFQYNKAEPPLTRSLRAFAAAVEAGGTDDYRFGAHWAVDVARVLEASEALILQ